MQYVDLERLKIRIITEQEKGASPLVIKSINSHEFKLQSYQEISDIDKIKKCTIALFVAKQWRRYEVDSFSPRIYQDGPMECLTFSFKDKKMRESFKRDLSLAIR